MVFSSSIMERNSGKFALLLALSFLFPINALGANPDPNALARFKDKLEPVFMTAKGRQAQEAWEAGRNSECAAAFEAVARNAPDQFHRITARFRAARCFERAGEFKAAAKGYEEVRDIRALLAPLAALRLSVVRFEQRRIDEALSLIEEPIKDPVLRARAQSFRARILEVGGRDKELAEGFSTAVTASLALKAGQARNRLGQKKEALALVKRVIVMDPKSSAASEASSLLRTLKPGCFEDGEGYSCFSPKEIIELARSLYRKHASHEVIELIKPRMKSAEFSGAELRCAGQLLLARSNTKLRDRRKSLPHYAAARGPCLDRAEEPDVLYFQGVDAFRESQYTVAQGAFDRLHKAYPDHSYNDDAVLYEAATLEAKGKLKAADSLLLASLSRYPKGDMRQEVGWRYVWSALKRSKIKKALKRIEEVRKLLPEARGYKGKGRLDYWEARLLERSGKARAALKGYERVLSSARLSYHALLAFQRLRIKKGTQYAERALSAALKASSAGKGGEGQTLKGPIGRIALLVRMGLVEEAEREIQSLGRGNDPDALLFVAQLADRVGVHSLSVMILRRYLAGFSDLPVERYALKVWKLAYPEAFEESVRGHTAAAGVDPFLAWSITREESGFVADIESWANAVGLMQLILPTAEKMARSGSRVEVSPSLLRVPDLNIRLGVRYLKHLQKLLPHPALIIAGYNAGEAKVQSWVRENGELTMDLFIASIPFRQTRGYTMRVLQSWFRYHVLYGGRAPKLDMSKGRVFRKGGGSRSRP